MDLYRTIQTLRDEQKRLEKLIESMEQLKASGGNGLVHRKTPARRGRKGMTADERRKVSERMKKYWEARRAVASSQDRSPSGSASAPTGPS
jgi:hypothetical protein